jgi:hypothetical protein
MSNPEPIMLALDEILAKYFGVKKPFLKKRRVRGYWHGDPSDPDYEYFTRAGGKAYEKLIDLLEDLGPLIGESFDSNHFVRELDRIVSEEY